MSYNITDMKNNPGSKITIIIIALAILLLLALTPGCNLNSRDSGSTVTGRAMSAPLMGGVPFARVLLNGENALRLQVTDSNGSFTMFNVPTGTYQVTFARFGLKLYSTQLVIDENDQTYIVNLPELQSGTATLSVGVTDNQTSVVGTDIYVIYPNLGIAQGVTDNNGAFQFTGLPDGTASVVIIEENYLTRIFENVKIGVHGISTIEAKLDVIPDHEGGTVYGTVANLDGELLDEAYVGIFPNQTQPSLYMVAEIEVLTENGEYILENIPPGTYTLISTRSGYTLSSQLVIVEADVSKQFDFVLGLDIVPWQQQNNN